MVLSLLLVLAPVLSAAMPRPRRAAKAVDDAAGASSAPVPLDVQHLDSDSQSLSSGSSPALATVIYAHSTEPCTGGQAPGCLVSGSTPFSVVEPSTCPARPMKAVAADAPKARARADHPVGWHHLPNPDVPDPEEATTLPPMGVPGHRLAVSRFPTFRPNLRWLGV